MGSNPALPGAKGPKSREMLKRISNDAAEAWGVGFQDMGSPMMRGVVELYNNVMYYTAMILVLVI